MNRLECLVSLGQARMQFWVELAIWRHEPFGPGGYIAAVERRPAWPQRCEGCTCDPFPNHLKQSLNAGGEG